MSSLNFGGVNIAIIFNGLLDKDELDTLSTYLSEDPDVTEFKFDTAEIVSESKQDTDEDQSTKVIECTSAIISLNQLFPIGFKWRFQHHSSGRLMRSEESPYVYYYVV